MNWHAPRMQRLVKHYRECVYHGRNPALTPSAPSDDPAVNAASSKLALLEQVRLAMAQPLELSESESHVHSDRSSFDEMYDDVPPPVSALPRNAAPASSVSRTIAAEPAALPISAAGSTPSAQPSIRVVQTGSRSSEPPSSHALPRAPSLAGHRSSSTASSSSRRVPTTIPVPGPSLAAATSDDLHVEQVGSEMAALDLTEQPPQAGPIRKKGARRTKALEPVEVQRRSERAAAKGSKRS